MEEIYYVDRPSVPTTQQNIIHLDSVTEYSICVDAVDINDSYSAHAVEVRNSAGEVDGTLLYFPGVTYAKLISPLSTYQDTLDEEPMLDEAEAKAEVELFDGAEIGVNELTDTPQMLDQFNAESKLVDLELELAEAVHHVQELEDEIAAIEKEAFID